jgi:hypothetical protein
MRDSIELATPFMFTPDGCHTNQFKVINRFTRNSKWENSNFFVEKYSNFYGCTMKLDFEDNLLHDVLNFTQKVVKPSGTIDKTSILFAFRPLPIEKLENFNTYVAHVESLTIFFPQGEVYGEYEKMFLPFDVSTWIAIGLTIFVSSLAILVIRYISPGNKEVFFGRNNRSPLMNFISILLNGSQTRSIAENAPRIFVLTFIFWSLIFR